MLKLKCLHFTSKNTLVNQKDIKNNYPYRLSKFQILFSMCFCQTTNTVTSFLCLDFFPATILERAIILLLIGSHIYGFSSTISHFHQIKENMFFLMKGKSKKLS